MSFTKLSTDVDVHQKLGDYPNSDDGMTAQQLKQEFDKPADILKEALNRLVDELNAESASRSLGADAIHETDETDGNVQAKLEYLYSELQDVVAGQIPDGSITEEKIATEYKEKINNTISENKLVSQYNIPDFESDSTDKTLYTNPIPTEWDEVIEGTKYKKNGYVIEASSYSSNNEVYKAFDGETGNYSCWSASSSDNNKNIIIDFKGEIQINQMRLRYWINGYSTIFKVQGSNDKTQWTDLYTSSNIQETSNKNLDMTFSVTGLYRYYKLLIDNSYPSTRIFEWYITEYITYDNILTLDVPIEEYKEGMRIMLDIPEINRGDSDTTLDINELGAIELTGDVYKCRVELTYDGENFISHKVWYEE